MPGGQKGRFEGGVPERVVDTRASVSQGIRAGIRAVA